MKPLPSTARPDHFLVTADAKFPGKVTGQRRIRGRDPQGLVVLEGGRRAVDQRTMVLCGLTGKLEQLDVGTDLRAPVTLSVIARASDLQGEGHELIARLLNRPACWLLPADVRTAQDLHKLSGQAVSRG